MKVIVRFLFFLMFSIDFSFASDGFDFFTNSNFTEHEQRKSKKRPFSEIEEEQKEDDSQKHQLTLKAQLSSQLEHIDIQLHCSNQDSLRNAARDLKELLTKQWFFDGIKKLLWDVDYDQMCCDILAFIGKNNFFAMTDRLQALEILDTARQPFLSLKSPHEQALKGCFLISIESQMWAHYQSACQANNNAILNFRVVQYINDLIWKHESTLPEDFLNSLKSMACQSSGVSYFYRRAAYQKLLQSKNQNFILPACLSVAKDTSIPPQERRAAVFALMQENITAPQAIEVYRAVLGSDYYDEIVGLSEKIKIINTLLAKIPRDNNTNKLRTYLDNKRKKLQGRNSILWDVFNGFYYFNTLRAKRARKEENNRSFINGSGNLIFHSLFRSVMLKGENYTNLINFLDKNPNEESYAALNVLKKKQLIGRSNDVLLQAVLSKINFYPFYQEVIQSSRKRTTPSLAVIDTGFDFSLWPHSHCTHVAKTKAAKETAKTGHHGTLVAQTAFNIFKKWGVEKTGIHLITMRSPGFTYKTDAQAFSRKVSPSTTFSISYRPSDNAPNCTLSQITKNVHSLVRESDRLMVYAAGNKGVPIEKAGHKHLSYLLDSEDILEHVIFAGSWDATNNSFATYSNHAGVYKDHFVIAPGNYLGTPSDLQQGFSYLSPWAKGTSFAAPVISASVSILRSLFPQANYKDVKEAVLSTAQKNFLGYKPEIHGQGILDMYQAYLLLKSKFQPSMH